MGACGSSVADAFAELKKAQIDHTKLASSLQSDSANLLAVKSNQLLFVSCSLLIKAVHRQDARAVQVIVDAAAKRGSAYLSRVLNQELSTDEVSPFHVPLRPAWPWGYDLAGSLDCLRPLFARDETELWPQQDGKGYSVFVAQLSTRGTGGGADTLKALLKLCAERGEQFHAAAVRALSLADSNGITPMMAAAAGGQRSAVEHLIELGVSPRLQFRECALRGPVNLSRFPPLAFCFDRHVDASVQEPLFLHTPLDERRTAQDPTLFMLSGKLSSDFVNNARRMHRERKAGASAEYKDPFRRPLPAVEDGGEPKEAVLVPDYGARPDLDGPAWWWPHFDVFATCSLFWVPAGEEDKKRARPRDPRLRFHPPALHSTFEHVHSFAWSAPHEFCVPAHRLETREWDSGFTVLHCPDSIDGLGPAYHALEIARDLYTGDTLRRFVRMRSTQHRWTALHMACAMGHRRLAEMLLETGHCDVNAQTDLGATALHLLLASNSKSLSKTYDAGGLLDFGELCPVLRALLAAGARDDLLTVDGDCAARLLAELLEQKTDWGALPAEHKVRALLEEYSQGGESDAVEQTLSELGVFNAPLVSLVLDYNGRAQLHYRRFLGRSAFVRDSKLPELLAPRRPHFHLCTSFIVGMV